MLGLKRVKNMVDNDIIMNEQVHDLHKRKKTASSYCIVEVSNYKYAQHSRKKRVSCKDYTLFSVHTQLV